MKQKINKVLNLMVGTIWTSMAVNSKDGWVWQLFLLIMAGWWLYTHDWCSTK